MKANWVGGRPPDELASPAAPTSELASSDVDPLGDRRAPEAGGGGELAARARDAVAQQLEQGAGAVHGASETHPPSAFPRHLLLDIRQKCRRVGLDGPWGTRGEAGRDAPSRPEQGDPTSMRSSRTRLGFAALAVTALTLGVACGDDDDDDAGGDTDHRQRGDDRGHDRRHHRRHDRRHHRATTGAARPRAGRLRHRRQQHARRQRLAGGDDLRGQGRVARQRPGQRGDRDLQERWPDRPDQGPAEPDLPGRQRDHRQPVRPRAAQPGHRGGHRPGHRRRRRRPGRHGRGRLRRHQRPGRVRPPRRRVARRSDRRRGQRPVHARASTAFPPMPTATPASRR